MSNGKNTKLKSVPYRRILVPTDGSETANASVIQACRLANELQARVRIIHIVEEIAGMPPELYRGNFSELLDCLRNIGQSALFHASFLARQAGIAADTQLIDRFGSSAGKQVIKAAEDWATDLIVCGSHGRRGLRRAVMGSDAEYVVRHSRVPVLLVRQRACEVSGALPS